MAALLSLWRFGSVRWPGDDESVRGNWEYALSAFESDAAALVGRRLWSDIVSCEPYLQRLYIAEARWRLAKAVIAGAAVGLWLALVAS